MYRILILLLTLTLAGCEKPVTHQSQSYVFGTLVDITIVGESEERALTHAAHIQREFQRLHDQLHAWKDTSELSRINLALASGKTAPIAPEMATMLADATQLSERSQGLFNPSIGGLIELWGFQRDEFSPVQPDPQLLQALVQANPRMTDIVVEAGSVGSKNPTVKLDLGGYAKGYALDLAAKYLRAQKVKGALINIGGNIIAIGQHNDRPWRVGIQHPRKPQAIATLDLPDGWAIGTSGDYQRYFEVDGKRYCHIINPLTGMPGEGVQAVTVLIPPASNAGTLSDVLSKPLFLSGPEHWLEAANRLSIAYAMLVDANGKVQLTPELQKVLKLEP